MGLGMVAAALLLATPSSPTPPAERFEILREPAFTFSLRASPYIPLMDDDWDVVAAFSVGIYATSRIGFEATVLATPVFGLGNAPPLALAGAESSAGVEPHETVDPVMTVVFGFTGVPALGMLRGPGPASSRAVEMLFGFGGGLQVVALERLTTGDPLVTIEGTTTHIRPVMSTELGMRIAAQPTLAFRMGGRFLLGPDEVLTPGGNVGLAGLATGDRSLCRPGPGGAVAAACRAVAYGAWTLEFGVEFTHNARLMRVVR